jgi:hypothetical protein
VIYHAGRDGEGRTLGDLIAGHRRFVKGFADGGWDGRVEAEDLVSKGVQVGKTIDIGGRYGGFEIAN